MVSAQLMDFDPQTGKPLDTIAFAAQRKRTRGSLKPTKVKIHIIGFAKMAGDVANGAKGRIAVLRSPGHGLPLL